MGLNLGTIMKVASVASTIGSHVDLGDIASGINLSNISPSSIPGISEQVVGKLTQKAGSITSELTGVKLDGLDPESITSSMNIDSRVDKMMSDIESKSKSEVTSSNPDDYDSLLNSIDIEGQMDSMVNETLSSMGLDSIKYM